MTTAHVFIATSLDGFIARPDGSIDWLLQRDSAGEDHGYAAFIADKERIVMGRGSYEKVLSFDPWPYDRPVLVMSRRPTDIPPRLQGRVSVCALSPRQMMAELHAQGVARIYLDGGQLVQSFLREGLVTDLVITTVPVLLGQGRPLFGPLPGDLPLQLVSCRSFASGMVQSTYRVQP